eukprot:4232176-Amphidinium_carterae.1
MAETPSNAKQRFGPRGRALNTSGNMNKPRSLQTKRTNSRARGATAGSSSRRGESQEASSSRDADMPAPRGLPTQYGAQGDSTERSRSARRQKERSPSPMKGSEPRRDHDFSDYIDYAGEDSIIEEDDREVEQDDDYSIRGRRREVRVQRQN